MSRSFRTLAAAACLVSLACLCVIVSQASIPEPAQSSEAPASPGTKHPTLIAQASLPEPAQSSEVLPYKNPRLPTAERVRDLLSRMTLEEKFWQLYMIPEDGLAVANPLEGPSPQAAAEAANDYSLGIFGLQIRRIGPDGVKPGSASEAARLHAARINDIQRFFVEKTRLGIPIVPFEEAVHGLVSDGGTMFPAAIGLAATWDEQLVARVASAIARETRTRGIRQVLSPVVNIADDVRWGRVEETCGEDPYLASVMGSAFVKAFESVGVVTTPKHFVANAGEGGRDSYPIFHSDRLLSERYFPPFEDAVTRAGARSIMTAYNSVDGSPATQSRWLLTEVLRGRWRFPGFVISDAAATGGATVLHMTEPDTPAAAAHAWLSGLDVVFQTRFAQHRPYLEAIRRGLVPQEVVDAAVARVLAVKFDLGLFELPYVDPEAAAAASGSASHIALAREAAAASVVLLKNEGGLLPLAGELSSIAVIGTDAVEARLGGYSGSAPAKVSILDGLRQKLEPRARIRYAPGPGRLARNHVVVPAGSLSTVSDGKTLPGLTGEYFDNNALEGQPKIVRTDARIDFSWTLNSPGRLIPLDWYSVRWTGKLTAPPEGVRRLGVEGNDGYRLWLNGRLIVDNWKKQSFGARLAGVDLAPGSTNDIRLEFFESTGNARVRLVWDLGEEDWRARIDEAVSAALESDVAMVVAGIEEGEFRDRAFLNLPGHQEELIEKVAATGKPVVVILVGGSAVTMSRWIDRVAAVLVVWYPGEQGGPAVAEIITGDANPAGRLPVTFPLAEGQLPLYYNHKPTGRGDDYVDLTGHPAFPFGHGLSYTTFAYSALRVDPETIPPDGKVTIRCTVTNTGKRTGDEVVQLYVRDVLASVARPVMELKGFRRVRLAAGESKEVVFDLEAAQVRMLDEHMRWVVEPGTFRVMVGASSRDIRLRGHFTVGRR